MMQKFYIIADSNHTYFITQYEKEARAWLHGDDSGLALTLTEVRCDVILRTELEITNATL